MKTIEATLEHMLFWEVFGHGPSGQCKRVLVTGRKCDAEEECARLNTEEQENGRGATGWYYVVESRQSIAKVEGR